MVDARSGLGSDLMSDFFDPLLPPWTRARWDRGPSPFCSKPDPVLVGVGGMFNGSGARCCAVCGMASIHDPQIAPPYEALVAAARRLGYPTPERHPHGEDRETSVR